MRRYPKRIAKRYKQELPEVAMRSSDDRLISALKEACESTHCYELGTFHCRYCLLSSRRIVVADRRLLILAASEASYHEVTPCVNTHKL